MICRVPLERIFDNPFQTRTVYTEIEELTQSILKMREARRETSGLIQVPPARIIMANGKAGWKVLNPDEYGGVESCLSDEDSAFLQLAAGHRRFRAFAQLHLPQSAAHGLCHLSSGRLSGRQWLG